MRPKPLIWIVQASLVVVAGLGGAPRAVAGSPADAPADPAPAKVDIAPARAKMVVYHQNQKQYLVVTPHQMASGFAAASDYLFYGDGKTFYRLPVQSSSANGKAIYSFGIPDPRTVYGYQSSLDVENGVATYTCEERKTKLERLDKSAADQLLDGASFYDVFWRRVPHALARDASGTYYYVDRLGARDPARGTPRGCRVFVGMRGKMNELKMRNVVSDPAGEIFMTNQGRLRLIINRQENDKVTALWLAPKVRRPLVWVDLNDPRTGVIVYRELGVYLGQKLHRPCDDL